jgi:hypothetical protein
MTLASAIATPGDLSSRRWEVVADTFLPLTDRKSVV